MSVRSRSIMKQKLKEDPMFIKSHTVMVTKYTFIVIFSISSQKKNKKKRPKTSYAHPTRQQPNMFNISETQSDRKQVNEDSTITVIVTYYSLRSI